MANLNDFKILKIKCINQYNLALNSIKSLGGVEPLRLADSQKERFGFYYVILQNYSGLSDYDDITEAICDTDFNAKFFNSPIDDQGIDAVVINDEEQEIDLFNFKYRDTFNPDKEQSKNAVILSTKLLNILANGENNLDGKIHDIVEEINDRISSNDIWKINLYIISNESNTINGIDDTIHQLEKLYGVNVIPLGLNEITDKIALKHKVINASLILDNDAVMSFTETTLDTNKSFIVRLPLNELIRITCDNDILRNRYNNEDDQAILNANLDIQVLYDNVRGFILNSKFNRNIEKTLDNEPTKFFFYNNGLTIVAEEIHSYGNFGNKKTKLEIKDFQVLNGGQTLRTIYNYLEKSKSNVIDKLSSAEVLVRFLNITDEEIKNYIGEYTNSQNAINLRDLKSLRKEQVQLESFLAEHKILYIRKRGETGSDTKDYSVSVSMERMGQILMATLLGRPDQVSNKKKEIFNSYYDQLFTNNELLCTEKTVDLIISFNVIGEVYRKYRMSSSTSVTYQKKMYILYLSEKLDDNDFTELVNCFEKFLKDYAEQHNVSEGTKSNSRYLINANFKMALDKHFKIIG
jgi:hypothetical protein